LEDAWNAAVGEPSCRQTRLGEVRRGVLNVTVAHSTLLEDLAAFRKPDLLAALRSGAPATTIHDIRFRVGAIAPEVKPVAVAASAQDVMPTPSRRSRSGDSGKPLPGTSHNPERS
jgi:predicted nucleic acid-binding Zn ribbon protein